MNPAQFLKLNLFERVQWVRLAVLNTRRCLRVLLWVEKRLVAQMNRRPAIIAEIAERRAANDSNGYKLARKKLARWERLAGITTLFLLLPLLALGQSPSVPSTVTVPAVPKGTPIGLEWNHSAGATGYNLYWSTNQTTWRLLGSVPYTNRAQVYYTNFPTWWRATATDGTTESDFSNIAGVLGVDRIVTVWSESSSNLKTWTYLAPVTTRTNPVGLDFVRVALNTTNRLRTE